MSSGAGSSRDRVRAARALVDIVHGGKTTDQTFGYGELSPLLQELVFGTLRYYYCLEPLVSRHLSRPLRTKDLDLRCLMLVGAYQLHYTRIPDHASIFETVNACRGLKKPWARGLVNAVLRKVADEQPDERSFGLPEWWLQLLRRDYPDQAQDLARATLARAPMSLRVNTRRIDPGAYRAGLRAAGLTAHPGGYPEHLILDSPTPIRELPGYAEGQVSVQDGGAQLVARLVIGSEPPSRLLDACAAPGGKLFHLAELAPQATVVGVERSPARFEHLQREAQRLGHRQVVLRLGDATGTEWLGDDLPAQFDAILLDAPCSGSGTLRRHPDIKLLRRPGDLARYADLQGHLLASLWPLLAPGGRLTYCTCSVFAEENDSVIDRFLASTPEAMVEPPILPEAFPFPVGRASSRQPSEATALTQDRAPPTGQATVHGWQLLPLPPDPGGPDRTVDGFYFARLTHREKAR